jgi:UDP-N-acetylglucosamine 1-carboxyvinyltransferase
MDQGEPLTQFADSDGEFKASTSIAGVMSSHTGEKFRVVGGAHLRGEVEVSGAKNSVLKLMAAALLAPGKTQLGNVPDIADVAIMSELLDRLGCQVTRNLESSAMEIDVPNTPAHRADYDLVRKMRASINVLGPLVARCGEAEVALPGGDAIGSRGLDYHIKGLIEMGVKIHNEHGYVIARAPGGLTGAEITLDFPSVGATENIMTAAVLARGTTILDNAAREPDVVDLGEFLIAMGADIEGLGTPTITIHGVESLQPVAHTTVPDRIVTGTWAFAAAITLGDITIHRCNPKHLEVPLEKLASAGAVVTTTLDGVRVHMENRPRAIDVSTLPYPGFPTDLQPFIITMNAIADGDAIVTENVFESRFIFVNELLRLGAQIKVDGHHAATKGIEQLSSAPVVATDIRAGAGLVIAGLVADGVTIVEGGFHIDRGYPNFADELRSLGADVTRVA